MTQTITHFAWEAQLHKEAYSAAINSVLRTPGTKHRFAARVGITPQYLSYLLDPNDPRAPGPEVPQNIANTLPKQALNMAATTGLTQAFIEMRQSDGPTMGPLLHDMRLLPNEAGTNEL